MHWMLFLGLGLAVGGGFMFLLSHIVGEIPAKWPFEPINRHDEPDRFSFWQDIYGGVSAVGVLLLLAVLVLRSFGWPV